MAPCRLVPRAWESLYVADSGAGGAAPAGGQRAGPAVMLVHGQPGSGADWDDVRLVLEQRRRVLVVDRPGYGRSRLAPASMAENADMLADVALGRAAAPAVVVGHSYGGGVALLMAARRPEAVAGLVLLGSVGPRTSVNGFDRLLARPGLGDALSAAGLFTVGRLLPRLRPLARHLPARTAARVRAGLPDGRYAAVLSAGGLRMWRSFVAEQRSLLAEIDDLERAMSRVRAPTAVVTGTRDPVVPPSAAATTAAAIPGSELVMLAGIGHFLARDAPRAVAEVVGRVAAQVMRGRDTGAST